MTVELDEIFPLSRLRERVPEGRVRVCLRCLGSCIVKAFKAVIFLAPDGIHDQLPNTLIRRFAPPSPASGRKGKLSSGTGKFYRLLMTLSVLSAALGLALLGEGVWIKAKAGLAQILLESAFAQSIATGEPVKPWRWADTWPVARLDVPRLKASSIVLASGSGQALAFGPGHLDATAKPGEPGTAVFAAHRDTHFRFLGELKPGDEIKVTRDDGITFTYEMTGAEIVRWDRSNIDASASGYNLALATCWPLDGSFRGPLRYVVHARLKPLAMFGGNGAGKNSDDT